MPTIHRARTIVCAVVLLAAMAACAAPPPQDRSSNTTLSAQAASRVASRLAGESTVGQIQAAAELWVRMEGSTEGFADSFSTSEPQLSAAVRSISDDAVVLEYATGECISGPLPSGHITSVDC